jgi:hypothetical protein
VTVARWHPQLGLRGVGKTTASRAEGRRKTDKPKPRSKLFERLKLPSNCRDVTAEYAGKIFIMRPAPIDTPGDYGDSPLSMRRPNRPLSRKTLLRQHLNRPPRRPIVICL